MDRRACPLMSCLLGAGLVLTSVRLRKAQAELGRLRASADAATPDAATPDAATPAAPAVAVDGAAPSGSLAAADSAALAAEWEQAVPPMDS